MDKEIEVIFAIVSSVALWSLWVNYQLSKALRKRDETISIADDLIKQKDRDWNYLRCSINDAIRSAAVYGYNECLSDVRQDVSNDTDMDRKLRTMEVCSAVVEKFGISE